MNAAFSSKDILFLILELVLSIGATVLFSIGIFNIVTFSVIIGVFLFVGMIIFLQTKINEISRVSERHEFELKKYEEKFKIYDRLAKLEAKVYG